MPSSLPSATIDLNALAHNFKQVQQHAPDSKIMSVIKADAYGHGAVAVAQALADSDAFAVARLPEALALRQADITKPIVLLEGVLNADDLQQASVHHCIPVLNTIEQVTTFVNTRLDKPFNSIWVKVDTGMHRLGLPITAIHSVWQRITASPNVSGRVGLMSHFANADAVADPANKVQLNRFSDLTAKLGETIETSMANSAAILSQPASHGDWVRPGLMLYGMSPLAGHVAAELNLKPVLQLQAEIIAIQSLQTGEQVGYGGTWICPEPMQVGVIALGYGDGYPRVLSSIGQVSLRGQLLPVIGRVSMDMITIDLRTQPHAEVGDIVTVWGDDILPIETVATQAQTINYELTCQLTPRVPRILKEA